MRNAQGSTLLLSRCAFCAKLQFPHLPCPRHLLLALLAIEGINTLPTLIFGTLPKLPSLHLSQNTASAYTAPKAIDKRLCVFAFSFVYFNSHKLVTCDMLQMTCDF